MNQEGVFPYLFIGVPYYGRVTADGGTPFYTYTIISGVLPSGLVLDNITGEVTGTPTSKLMAAITVRATDLQGMYVDAIYVIPGTMPSAVIPTLSRVWRYKVVAASDSTDYRYGDDVPNWTITKGPFGNDLSATYSASTYDSRLLNQAQTLWPNSTTKDLWIAQTVTLPHQLAGAVKAVFFYDDTFKLYVNAVQVSAGSSYTGGSGHSTTIPASAFVEGQNRIIARLTNGDGNAFAYFDMQWGMA